MINISINKIFSRISDKQTQEFWTALSEPIMFALINLMIQYWLSFFISRIIYYLKRK
jgi:hypothetical protein